MPAKGGRVGKRKETDPELAELLKMVLAKLGNDEEVAGPVQVTESALGEDRPRRTGLPSRAAFPPAPKS